MAAHGPVNIESVASDKDFYERFIELRLKLKTLGAEIVSVHHANYWVDVGWLPQGADRSDKPIRSTLFRPISERGTNESRGFLFSPDVAGAMGVAG